MTTQPVYTFLRFGEEFARATFEKPNDEIPTVLEVVRDGEVQIDNSLLLEYFERQYKPASPEQWEKAQTKKPPKP